MKKLVLLGLLSLAVTSCSTDSANIEFTKEQRQQMRNIVQEEINSAFVKYDNSTEMSEIADLNQINNWLKDNPLYFAFKSKYPENILLRDSYTKVLNSLDKSKTYLITTQGYFDKNSKKLVNKRIKNAEIFFKDSFKESELLKFKAELVDLEDSKPVILKNCYFACDRESRKVEFSIEELS